MTMERARACVCVCVQAVEEWRQAYMDLKSLHAEMAALPALGLHVCAWGVAGSEGD